MHTEVNQRHLATSQLSVTVAHPSCHWPETRDRAHIFMMAMQVLRWEPQLGCVDSECQKVPNDDLCCEDSSELHRGTQSKAQLHRQVLLEVAVVSANSIAWGQPLQHLELSKTSVPIARNHLKRMSLQQVELHRVPCLRLSSFAFRLLAKRKSPPRFLTCIHV